MTKLKTIVWITTLALLLAACGGGDPTATETPVLGLGSTEAATADAGGSGGGGGGGGVGSGLCAHTYYPVVIGATHTYSSSGSSTPFSFTDTITDVRADGFTLSSQFDGLVRTQEWQCTAEGLVTLQYTGGASAAIQTEGMSGVFETTGVTGVSLPHDVAPGDTWAQSFDISGTMNMATGDTATATGTAGYTFEAIGIEEVATAAGSFSALRIESVGNVTLVVSFGGVTVPVNLTSNAISWYAPGVGWVYTEDTATMEGGSFSYSIDLESYSIP
jgi:hypothetical protein